MHIVDVPISVAEFSVVGALCLSAHSARKRAEHWRKQSETLVRLAAAAQKCGIELEQKANARIGLLEHELNHMKIYNAGLKAANDVMLRRLDRPLRCD